MLPIKSWKKVNTWRFKGPVLAVAFLLGLFDHALHWGGIANRHKLRRKKGPQ